mmetsp:Transcript_28756/g.40424  ORF Transcript_28756/g.40424 Transcript_28756/m.40424 type:complete len:370 (-) Transcript_28756:338-1447(-)
MSTRNNSISGCCRGSFLLLAFSLVGTRIHAFQNPTTVRPKVDAKFPTLLKSSNYGRGAEIWPECNEDRIKLADSFPNGEIPQSASRALSSPVAIPTQQVSGRDDNKRVRVSARLAQILSNAAKDQEDEAFTNIQLPASLDKSPALIALVLLFARLVRPVDVLAVTFISGYFAILGQIARSTRTDGSTPIMPSLPPQGHVPALVSNPLGHMCTNSEGYRTWLKAGAIAGLAGPLAMLLRYTVFASRSASGVMQIDAARACARPIFFLCCQALCEAVSRRLMAPLPLRILIPIAYNAIRLVPLWGWALSPIPLGSTGRILAITNLLYWMANLFGFLIPVASMRYLRAHFLCIETEEVTTRKGLEESVGLLP